MGQSWKSDNAANDEQATTNSGPQPGHNAEYINLGLCTITTETVNTESESDSEHQSYEKVCTYEKVQPFNVNQLLVQLSEEGHYHQDPTLHHGGVSKKDSNGDSIGAIGSDENIETDPAESLDSYEQVWGYERIHHCDLPLEEFLAQKDDNTASAITKTDDT